MLKLKDKNKKLIAGLINYKDLCIESTLSTGDKKLSFSLPKEDKFYNFIEEECYIETKKDEFVIKARDVGVDYTRFDCVLNLEGLEANLFDRFESVEQTITNALNLAIVGTGWTVKDNTLKKKRTVRCVNKSSLEIVQELKRTYRVDIVFNTLEKQIEIHEHLGQDKGAYFIDSLNLTALQVQSDSYKFATRIIAEGKDGLTFSSINNGKNYVENYQYSKKVKTLYWKDERYTIKESLLEDARAKLEEISKPFISYNASILNLAELNPKYKSILDYSLGDTITLISRNNKVKDKQRIVKILEYPQDHSRDTVELANAVLKFEDIQQENQETTDTVNNITTDNGTIDGSTIDGIKVKQIEDFKANVVEVVNLKAINANIDNLHANKADIQDLHAVTAKIGTLEATKANITQLNAVNAEISKLNSIKANVTDLNAAVGKINVLESKTASIDNLLAGNLTANNFKANSIVAGSGIIADGAIGSAQISSLSVNKLEAGDITTSKHRIVSADGTIEIVGNQILINRNNVNRVVLGEYRKDDTTEYGLLVRAKDGQTIMLDGNGVHNAGITDGAIDNNKVADNANISGNKLDINSVIREVNNNGTETIKGTKVTVGDRTLDVELSTQKNTITEHSKELSSQKASLTALDSAIKLKVDSQTFSQATENINSNINKVNTHLNKNTSEINILKDKIESKVSQTDIDNSIQNISIGGRNLLTSSIINKFYGSAIKNEDGSYTLISSNSASYFQNDIVLEGQDKDSEFTFSVAIKHNIGSIPKKVRITVWHDGSWDDNYISDQLTNEFKIFSKTVKLKNKSNVGLCVQIDGTDELGNKITFKNLKLEKGNKTTDYTEAPEDTNKLIIDNIKTVTDKISTVESKFTQENNSIKASVQDLNSTTQTITTNVSNINRDLTSKINSNLDAAKNFATDIATNKANTAKQEAISSAKAFVNAEITTINSKVHNVESNLNILKDKIESKVSQSDIDKSISEIKLGGRNLILKSDVELEGTSPKDIQVGKLSDAQFITGKTVTVSLDLEFEDLSGNRVGYEMALAFEDGSTQYIACWHYVGSSPKKTFNGRISSVWNVKQGRIINIHYSGLYIQCNGKKIKIGRPKIELGNKATDWSPAPEDLNQSIADNIKVVNSKISDVSSSVTQLRDSVTTQINSINSKTNSIETNLNGKATKQEVTAVDSKVTTIKTDLSSITQRVSNSEVKTNKLNDNIQSLSSRMQSAEQKITPTSIINTVSSTIDTRINAIEIGGRNYILNSNFINLTPGSSAINKWKVWGDISVFGRQGQENYNENGVVYLGALAGGGIWQELSSKLIKKDTEYTLSLLIGQESNVKKSDCYIEYWNGNSKIKTVQIFTFSGGLSLERRSFKFRTITNNFTEIRLVLNHGGASSASAYLLQLGLIKLEEGKFNTAWTPAPEDVTQEFSEMKANFSVTINGINSEVSKKVNFNEVISRINQSAEGVKINANKIDLNGYVTATDLAGKGTTVINGANIRTGEIFGIAINSCYFEGKNMMYIREGGTFSCDGPVYAKDFYVPKNGKFAVEPEAWFSNTVHAKSFLADGNKVPISIFGNKWVVESFQGVSVPNGNAMQFRMVGGSTFYSDLWMSDKKLKENIKNVNEREHNSKNKIGLDLIKSINHYSFNYKDDKNNTVECGYISQDLQENNKQLVVAGMQEDGTEILQPRVSTIIPNLSLAIQEQQKIIEKLERRIEELERKAI